VCLSVCVCVCAKGKAREKKSRAPAGALPTVMPRAVLPGPPIPLAVSAAARGTLKHNIYSSSVLYWSSVLY
jgi:hypothetical protein